MQYVNRYGSIMWHFDKCHKWRTIGAGCVIMLSIITLAILGGCSTTQTAPDGTITTVNTTTTDVLNMTLAILNAADITAQKFCTTGQISAATCTKIQTDYTAANAAVTAITAIVNTAGSIQAAQSKPDYGVAMADIMTAIFDINNAISAAKGGK